MTFGYTYYNRPGADLTTHNAEVTQCVSEALKTVSASHVMGLPGTYVVLEGAGFAAGAAMGGASYLMARDRIPSADNTVRAAALEDCMVVRGWRVVQLSDDEGGALAALSQEGLVKRLTPWVGAVHPHGGIVRSWDNDAAHGSTIRYAFGPAFFEEGQLGLRLATGQASIKYPDKPVDAAATSVAHQDNAADIDGRWTRTPLTVDQLADPPPGGAILIVRYAGRSLSKKDRLVFQRLTNPGAEAPDDHGPDVIEPAPVGGRSKALGPFLAYAVPPGRWRIAAMGGLPYIDFCFGAPAFDVSAGDVVYAGTFDFAAADIGPDMSLAPVTAFLAGAPAAAKLRPAAYVNGSRARCSDTVLYAFEIKGAPYEPGYTWGGAAAAMQAPPR